MFRHFRRRQDLRCICFLVEARFYNNWKKFARTGIGRYNRYDFDMNVESRPTPGFMTFTVNGCGLLGEPKAMSLSVGSKIYLFNCGDGMQKVVLNEEVQSAARLDHIFVTQFTWSNIGGIYGKSMLAQSSSKPLILIHGAKEMKDLLSHSMMFSDEEVFHTQFEFRDMSDGPFKDNDILVEYAPLFSKQTSQPKVSKGKLVVKKCHLSRNSAGSFGFVCVTKNDKPGFFVRDVKKDSNAEIAGLDRGDRIVEINEVNIDQYTFEEVIKRIQGSESEMRLLAVDEQCDKYCKENQLVISSSMSDTDAVFVENRYDNQAATQIKIKHLPTMYTEENVLDVIGRENVVKVVPPWMTYKGFVFVYYKTREDAVKAALAINNMKHKGHILKARHVEKEEIKNLELNRLHVRNLPFHATKEDLEVLLGDLSKDIEISLHKNDETADNNLGDCLMYCKSKDTLNKAVNKLEGFQFKGRTLYTGSSGYNMNENEYHLAPSVDASETRPVMSYIVKFNPENPKVKKEVLQDLGIKEGPFIREIIEGKSVEQNGVLITPEMLLRKSKIVKPVLIIDCPSMNYIDSLLASKELSALHDDPDTVPQLVVHFSPHSIVTDPRYQQFMKRFDPKDTSHLMLNETAESRGSVHVIRNQLINNKIHNEIFPLLQQEPSRNRGMEGNIVEGVSQLQYRLKNSPCGRLGFSWDKVLEVEPEKVLSSVFTSSIYQSEYKMILEETYKKCRESETPKNEYPEYPVFTFLGTGSSMPSRLRNQTCTLVETSKDEFLMLDCGEATLMQLYTMFGRDKAEEILTKLKAIFVSHMHFDHHGGIMSVAMKRQELLAKQNHFERLLLIAPSKMWKWLTKLSRHVYNTDRLFETIPLVKPLPNDKHMFEQKLYRKIQSELNVTEFNAIPVDHVIGSFGAYLKHADGWSLMYSGDTRPIQSLVKTGYEKTDYLIHEATFSSTQETLAYSKRHSTIEQAVNIGKQMKAKYIILTHFSQRFFKHPVFADLPDGVAFAYDFMQLKPKHIASVSHLKTALATCNEDIRFLENRNFREEILARMQDEYLAAEKSKEDPPKAKVAKMDDKSV